MLRIRTLGGLFCIALLLGVGACAGEPATAFDGGADAPAAACGTHDDCSDDVFCNGRESCVAGACLPAIAPCLEEQTCNESVERCLTDCTVTRDADDDGESAIECGGADCDDSDPNRRPGATEVCDVEDRDEDCDPSTFGVRDADGDGSPDEACCNGAADGDRTCGDDCDDSRSNVHPGNTEACDAFDNDCDVEIDEGVALTCYADDDDDGFAPAEAAPRTACSCPAGTTTRAPESASTIDCDDTSDLVSPRAVEVCDEGALDENCDGEANPTSLCACADDVTRTCAIPGRCASGTQTCLAGEWSTCSIQPRDELCNAEDDDCDGSADEGVATTCATDGDRDGYAAAGAALLEACTCPDGTTSMLPATGATDCDDSLAEVSPARTELCDAARLDENCDGEANPLTLCTCTTGSSRPCALPGACAAGVQTCAGGGWSACSVSASTEVCNSVDDDCDGTTDEGTLRTCYADGDNDGYARNATRILACACGAGTTANDPTSTGTDCNDGNPTIRPGAAEACDRIDSNCSSGGGVAANEDADNDGYAPTGASCSGGFPRTDCNDANASIHPGASELCDRVDSDCSGSASATAEDADNDGFAATSAACNGGFQRTDCNDANASIRPGAPELCDRIDSDCSGSATNEDSDGDGYAPLTAACSGGPLSRSDCDDTRASIAPCAVGCTGVVNGSRAYATCTAIADWNTARTVCAGMSMDLVTIDSAAENAWVRGRFSTTTYTMLWLGGTDSVAEGVWRWQDGRQFWMGGTGGSAVGGAYANWLSGQPNNDDNQDMLGMSTTGTWQDDDPDALRAYTCEAR